MTSKEQCCDDRFEIINETKQYIINATNIETSPEEMAVLDSICFRLWQLGLTKRNKDKLKELTQEPTFKECIEEWEKLNFKWEVHLGWLSLTNEKDDLIINIFVKNMRCYEIVNCTDEPIVFSFAFHNLIHKTLKALENCNETK